MNKAITENIPSTDGSKSQTVLRRQFEEGIPHVGKVSVKIIRKDGSVEEHAPVYNSRVNNGASVEATQLFTTAASAVAFNYIALTSTNITINATDTALSGEITSGTNAGLARYGPITPSYTAPSGLGNTYTVTFTHNFVSSASTTVYAIGLFSAASGGQLYAEASLSPNAVVANGDTISLTYSINS